MKKIFSLMIIAFLCFSVLCFSVTAFAAPEDCPIEFTKITVDSQNIDFMKQFDAQIKVGDEVNSVEVFDRNGDLLGYIPESAFNFTTDKLKHCCMELKDEYSSLLDPGCAVRLRFPRGNVVTYIKALSGSKQKYNLNAASRRAGQKQQEAPVSEAPVSEAPVSEAPVSEAPVSEAPVSEAPLPPVVSDAPVSEIPVVSETPVSSEAPVPPETPVGSVAPVPPETPEGTEGAAASETP